MSSRDDILARLRAVQPEGRPLPPVPLFADALPDHLDTFRKALARLGGDWVDCPADGDIGQVIRTRFPAARVICSAVPEVRGTRLLTPDTTPHSLNDVDVGIVRPAFAVAETGSIWLSEREFGVNALGYLSQHLVALLDPADLVGNLHQAYHLPEFLAARYAVLMSGPSATADIEGVLVRGAQGIRSLTVVAAPRRTATR
ncbi:LutC/YkgG family protein [Massilia sp. TN1-12]|uniref:LutC/YkgG family protein n=1 Tax=Massilia paldalensis TaxID=3377675 RepID=UPI00384BD907